MLSETIILQSAGSLSVAILALIMTALQLFFYINKRDSTYYAWGSAISFSAFIYSIGIFLEYNTPPGDLNRYAGILEYNAIILLVHCLFGYTLSYLEIESKKYHSVATIFHSIIIAILWSTDLFVDDTFVARNFRSLYLPFNEPDQGPLGVVFVMYASISALVAATIWIVNKKVDLKYRMTYLAGMSFWILLGIHDGIASLGVPTFQYLMEYGFLGFAIVVLIGVFHRYVDKTAEEKYRMITEYANDGILIIQDGKMVFGNPACRDLLGKPLTETAPSDFLEVMPAEDRKLIYEQYTSLHEKKQHVSPKLVQIICEKSMVKYVEISSSAILYRGRPAILAIMRDVTERKRDEEARQESEKKLAHLRKMESLGILAGGVAHDLNNLLSGITSYPELLLLDLPEDSHLRKPIETIQESGQRAACIVEDLLTLARGVSVSKEPLNVNHIIQEYVQSPEYEKLMYYHPLVAISKDLESDLLPINASSIHIRKAIMNLVSNASEAIDGDGKVVIETKNCYLNKPLKNYDEINEGEYVLISVSDNGGGILSGDLDRIFEPFYSKKVMGRSGTGLGLTLVWNVVNDHVGYVDVNSDDQWTTFELYFPAIRDETREKVSEIPFTELLGNGEKILVIDDVETQRNIISGILEKLKYDVACCSSGEEGINYLKSNEVDLVIVDMIMDPGINGRQTYREILEIHPGQKAIIVSGYSVSDDVKETLRMGAGQYIKKPYTINKLGNAVRHELTR